MVRLDQSFAYKYDANGNMTYDAYKKMHIYYNFLNLPDSIVFRGKGKIINQYLADGTLLERREIDNESKLLSKTNYEGLFLFRNDSLEYVFNDEGYVQNGRYHYVLADQTQSTRAVINEDGEVVQYNAFYPYGGLISNLSFNTEFNYTFGGKEKINTFGVGCSDFHARMFNTSLIDPPISWQLDGHAENFYAFSPYGLFGGNPISFIDPDGMRYISINDLLSNYGYASKEQQLFPSKTLYQNGVKIIQAVDNLLDPTAPIGVSVAAEIYKGTVEVKDAIEKDISKANRKDVIKYYNNLTEIDKAITEKLDDVNRSIKTLRREEAESGNLGINREEISSKTKQRWDLEYEQISVQFEIEKITPILEEPVIVR